MHSTSDIVALMSTELVKLWAPVPRELHREVKRLALETDRDMQDIVADAVREHIAKIKKNRKQG